MSFFQNLLYSFIATIWLVTITVTIICDIYNIMTIISYSILTLVSRIETKRKEKKIKRNLDPNFISLTQRLLIFLMFLLSITNLLIFLAKPKLKSFSLFLWLLNQPRRECSTFSWPYILSFSIWTRGSKEIH